MRMGEEHERTPLTFLTGSVELRETGRKCERLLNIDLNRVRGGMRERVCV